MLVDVGVKILEARFQAPCCSSGWSCRDAALGARVDLLAGTSDTEHISIGAHSQAGSMDPVARRQSLQ